MDFTVLPNEREIAELRRLLTGIEAASGARSTRRPAPRTHAGAWHRARGLHVLGGKPRRGQGAAGWRRSALEQRIGMEG